MGKDNGDPVPALYSKKFTTTHPHCQVYIGLDKKMVEIYICMRN